MSTYPIFDDEVLTKIPISIFFEDLKNYLIDDFKGNVTAPPRYRVAFDQDALVFTVGGNEHIAGFRAYETFKTNGRRTDDQIVALWDRQDCRLKAIAIGNRLGALRTGALGGIAVSALSSENANICAVIGSGQQAETQILATACVRKLNKIHVYSRNIQERNNFAKTIQSQTGVITISAKTAYEAVKNADIVILATNSRTQVIEADWIKSGAHITTVGPKLKTGYEFPIALADQTSVIVSDSPQQILSQGQDHMLYGLPAFDRLMHLGEVLAKSGNNKRDTTLYLSAGLAGSEVVALNSLLIYLNSNN